MFSLFKKKESEIAIKQESTGIQSTGKTAKMTIPKTSQQTIPFVEIYEGGVMLVEANKYTLVFGFENIDYSMLREDDQERKFKLYETIMNIIPPDIHYQEYITNSTLDRSELDKVMLPSEKRYESIYDDYVKVQSTFIKEAENTSAMKKQYIAISYKPISKRDDAQRRLLKTMREFDVTFKKLESSCTKMKPEEIFELLFEYYHPFSKDEFLLPKDMFRRGKTIKDYIAPSSFHFKNNYTEMGSAYNRVFYVKDYPEELSDTFIADILDNNYKISVAKHVDHIDKSEALDKLKQRVIDLEAQRQKRLEENKKNGTDYVPLDLQLPIDEANLMRKELNGNQELFNVGIYISLSAESKEELDDLTKTVKSVCRRHMVTIDTLTLCQEQAMNTVLPFANDKVKILRKQVARTMLTDSTAVLLPFSVQYMFTPTGFYYGKNSITNSLIILDRRNDKNSNGFILGKPGSGKSMKMKREIIDVLMKTDDDVIIIDPEREFSEIAKEFHGEVVYLEPSSDTYINPFDISEEYADGDDPFKEKSDFILTNLEILKGNPLTPKERTIADRCVILSYKEFRGNGGEWDYSKLPTYTTYYDILLKQPEKEAKDLALYIESYVLGSFNIFAKETNVNLKNRLTVFDQQKIGNALKKFGMQVTIDFIWQRLIENRKKGKNTWLYVDEFYLYFDDTEDKKTGTATAFLNFNKRCRKYGGALTGATQNVSQVMQSPEARLMLNNSQFMILLDQSPNDRAELVNLLNLSPTQEGYIKNVAQGSGLIVSGKRIIPFNDEYPKDNKIYRIITTDPKDVQKKLRQEEEEKQKQAS